MTRPLRIEYPGAVYHVTSRGDRREPIAVDDEDRERFLAVLDQAFERFDAHAFAYCLMGNHYHLVIRTQQGNLSRLMRHINGVYTQTFNRRHQVAGHLFQGRFKAILVDTDSYLLEVCRYVDLNPVRANMTDHPGDYAWSSYGALTGAVPPPPWLDTATVYAQLSPAKQRDLAARDYAEFVGQGRGVRLWDDALRQQIYLGDDAFINKMQAHVTHLNAATTTPATKQRSENLSKVQSSAPALDCGIEHFVRQAIAGEGTSARNQAMVDAFFKGGHTQTAIAQAFAVAASTVSRVIKASEGGAIRRN